MSTAEAEHRFYRAMRALGMAERAGLTGPEIEPFETQAADAYARFITLAGAQSPATVPGR